jgi:acyl-CoA thioesterase FadM
MFIREIEVGWRDLDAHGRVPIHQLIRWMEETEYEFLRSRGLSVSMYDERGRYGFPRLSAEVKVGEVVPEVGDCLRVLLVVLNVDAKSLTYQFGIAFVGRGLVAEGIFHIACCRFPAGKLPYAILIPDEFLLRFQK